MPWSNEIQSRINELNSYVATNGGLQTDIGQIELHIPKYIKSAGLNTVIASTINVKLRSLDMTLNKYKKLLNDMKKEMSGIRDDNDINGKLTTIAGLRRDIDILEKRRAEAQEDKDTSDARKQSVERADKTVSYNQLFGGIKRPIHPISVPILIILSIIFTVIACTIIYLILGGGGDVAGAGTGTGTGTVASVQQAIRPLNIIRM
jgi:hypothetical protein